MKHSNYLLIVCAAVCGSAVTVSAQTFVSDTFADGSRAEQNLPTESAWFTSNPAGMAVTPGHLVQTTASGSTSWQTYFAPEVSPATLANTGDSLKVTWVFTPNGVANDAANNGQGFRLALVNSPSANRVSTDVAPGAPSGGNYNGYAMFMNFDQTLRRTTPFQLMERGSGVAAFLSASADWTALANNGTTGNPGYVGGQQYTYSLTLTLNASAGLDIVSRMEGTGLGPSGQGYLEVSFTDTTPNSLSFDTFGLRPAGSATSATSFDTTKFEVVLSSVPEPSTFALAGLGFAALALMRRRR
jgi:hypothetical protein